MSKLRHLYQRWKNLSFYLKIFWVFTVAYMFTIHTPFYMCALFMVMLDAIKSLEAKIDEHMKGGKP